MAIVCLLSTTGCGTANDTRAQATDAAASAGTSTGSVQDTVPDAMARYDAILADDPNNVSALGGRGRLHWTLGRLEAARRDFSTLLEVDPSHVVALRDRARLLGEMGLARDALRDWAQLAELLPSEPEPRLGSGTALMQLGKPQEALEQFSIAMRLSPGVESVELNVAAAQYRLGDFQGARATYLTVLARNPRSAAAINGTGLLAQFVDGNEALAEQNYRQALAIDPNLEEAWFNIAFLEAGRGLQAQAIEDFGKAIRLDSSYVDARLNRGLLYIKENRPQDAIPDMEWITRRSPGNARAWLLQGWARCLAKQSMQGCLDLSRAKDLGQQDADQLIAKFCR